jgi:hypothetical protein
MQPLVTDPQARGISRHEEGTVFGGLSMRDQALKLLDAEDMGQGRSSGAWGEIQLDVGPAERFGVEKLQATRDLIAGTPGETALHQEVGQVVVDVAGFETIGGAVVEACRPLTAST